MISTLLVQLQESWRDFTRSRNGLNLLGVTLRISVRSCLYQQDKRDLGLISTFAVQARESRRKLVYKGEISEILEWSQPLRCRLENLRKISVR